MPLDGRACYQGAVIDPGRALRALLIVALAALSGCGEGPDDRWPVWSYLSPVIVQPKCATASCHSRGTAEAGLDLSSIESGYASLTDLELPVRGKDMIYPRRLVSPNAPDQSRLIWMLRGKGARNMPPDRPLPESDIRLFERWILMGARNE